MESGPESSWRRRYSASSVAQAASFIQFPNDVAKIESCRRTVSRFGMALDRTLDSGVSWAMEPQTLDYTPQDLEAIQHAHDFATTCTSLFTQMVEGVKCETPHQAKLHLSGFKQDQLQMRIRTCKDTDWVPAVFTRSLSDPAPEPYCFDHICSPTSSLPEGSGVLQLAFNAEGLWASNDTASLDTPNIHAGEQSLDHLLVQGDGLSLKYRKLAGVLLAASVFQLSNSPWIEHHLGPECIFMPSPDNKRLQQWCPRVLCSLAPKIYTGLRAIVSLLSGYSYWSWRLTERLAGPQTTKIG
ncbi:hypothetical protein GE09DRAFT_28940 [Coniochaeta sp. 2T2.1]|nr:hypothetical protein GE09DRAFT_28940 [Coniochaeta sp. 2T2.1]